MTPVREVLEDSPLAQQSPQAEVVTVDQPESPSASSQTRTSFNWAGDNENVRDILEKVE